MNEIEATEVLDMLSKDGQIGYAFNEFYNAIEEESLVFLRGWCAYYHAKNNDRWFNDSEREEMIDVFYKFFIELNLHNIIELA